MILGSMTNGDASSFSVAMISRFGSVSAPLNPPALGEPKPPPLNLFHTILAFSNKETENFHFCYLVPNKRCTCAFKRTNDQNNTHSLSSLSSFGSSYERLRALCMSTCLGHTQSTNGHSQLALPRLAAQEGGSQQSWARQHCPHKGPPSAEAVETTEKILKTKTVKTLQNYSKPYLSHPFSHSCLLLQLECKFPEVPTSLCKLRNLIIYWSG